MVLTQTPYIRTYLLTADQNAFDQATEALGAAHMALQVHQRAGEPVRVTQPVEELPHGLQRYNALLGLASDQARVGGDIGRAQVLATLALAEATVLARRF
jgi:hypothetical protein